VDNAILAKKSVAIVSCFAPTLSSFDSELPGIHENAGPSSLSLHDEQWYHIVLLRAGYQFPADRTLGLGTLMAGSAEPILSYYKGFAEAGVAEQMSWKKLVDGLW
jgi:hypothetical protein